MGAQRSEVNRCQACLKRITRRFAICSDCEAKYGHSAYEWEPWIRYGWNEEQRQRRKEKKLDEQWSWWDYDMHEGVLNYTGDGRPYYFSNKNPDKLLDGIIFDEALDLVPENVKRILMQYFVDGLTLDKIAELEGVTRANISYYLKKAYTIMRRHIT